MKPVFPHVTFCSLAGMSVEKMVREYENKTSLYNTRYKKMTAAIRNIFHLDKENINYTFLEKIQVLNEIDKQRSMFVNIGGRAIKLGYRLQDLVLNCTHDSVICSDEDFEEFRHPDFLRCYTYVGGYKHMHTLLSGPDRGLSLLLYNQYNEYISKLTNLAYTSHNPLLSSNGVRVVIHAPGTIPNVNDLGTDVKSGEATSIALQVSRFAYVRRRSSLSTDTCLDCFKNANDIS